MTSDQGGSSDALTGDPWTPSDPPPPPSSKVPEMSENEKPRAWCIDHGDGWKDPKCPVCFPERNRVFEGIVDGEIKGSLQGRSVFLAQSRTDRVNGGNTSEEDWIGGLEGKRVRITVEVLE